MDFTVRMTEDNTQAVKDALEAAKHKALTIIGMKIEKYAKALCPVGTTESTGKKGYRGGTLRNSITYQVDGDQVWAGSNIEYSPYVELGTGPNFVPPPDWEQFTSVPGVGTGHGYVRPRPYLRPAVEDHKAEFEDVIASELKKA